MSLYSDLHAAGQRALQARGHVNANQTVSGKTRGNRAGNPSIAASVHAHPGKQATPHPNHGQAATKAAAGSRARAAAQQVTTHMWS
jgi:hypothetical protein